MSTNFGRYSGRMTANFRYKRKAAKPDRWPEDGIANLEICSG
jgi:hypothetical protein